MLTRTYGHNVINAAKTTASDKLTWHPGGVARHALAQLRECAQAAEGFGHILETGGEGYVFDPERRERRKQLQLEANDLNQVAEEVEAGIAQMERGIRAVSNTEEDKAVELFPGFTATLRQLMVFPLRNFIYHEGQINYIQVLYGDSESHWSDSKPIGFPDRDTVAELVTGGVEGIVGFARATQTDKLTWSPEGKGRTILDMMEECRQSGGWGTNSLKVKDKFSFEGFDFDAVMKERMQEPDLDSWESRLRANHKEFLEVVANFPVEDENLVATPMPGFSLSMGDLAFYPAWNLFYHCGQIAFVQCLYGDGSMPPR
ncbi:MAG: hypothetical protein KF812_09100 [Fimbriimonadaceae bacterium]|nr:hypothetical protein [Fimbriimonadaceae bacterium]